MKLFTLVLTLSTIMIAQPQKNIATLQNAVDSILKNRQGRFALVFSDLQTGEKFFLNEREQFHAASTMKTPVMIEVFRQAATGSISLDDSITVKNSFQSIIDGSDFSLDLNDDSEDGLYSRIGRKESIRNLVFKMITVSSNLATNILIGIVGPDNIMKTMKSMGCNDIQVLRGVEDSKAFDAGKNNTTNAYDLTLLFEAIARKKVIDVAACAEMLNILHAQKFKSMIPALLPPDVTVAHKTGSITNVQHDSGIIYLPNGHAYVLVILSKNLNSNKEGIETIASLSKAVYDFVSQ
ncbi:MAG: serine hydrolase [Bacteriovoracaceae bacterium]|nr:class A beta-lactamase-related serine hydrolase [Bacteroidota bacterium]